MGRAAARQAVRTHGVDAVQLGEGWASPRHARPKVFLLWGAHAHAKARQIDTANHRLLRANHPSPLSALRGPTPFIGCGHFSQTNLFLRGLGEAPVSWLP